MLDKEHSLLATGFRNELMLWKIPGGSYRIFFTSNDENEELMCSSWTSLVFEEATPQAEHILAVGSSLGCIYLIDCGTKSNHS